MKYNVTAKGSLKCLGLVLLYYIPELPDETAFSCQNKMVASEKRPKRKLTTNQPAGWLAEDRASTSYLVAASKASTHTSIKPGAAELKLAGFG